MAYIYVDGEEFPYPERGLNVIVTTPVNSARDTKAEVVGQRISRDQYKINNLKWPHAVGRTVVVYLKKVPRRLWCAGNLSGSHHTGLDNLKDVSGGSQRGAVLDR